MGCQHIVECFPCNLPKVRNKFAGKAAKLHYSPGAEPIPDSVFPGPRYQEHGWRDIAVLLEDLPDTMFHAGLEFVLFHTPSFPGLNVIGDFLRPFFVLSPPLRQILLGNAFGFNQNSCAEFELRSVLPAALPRIPTREP